eukprot:gene20051-22018_t
MSICAIWVISLNDKQQHHVIFSRHYSTVKKRARKSNALHCISALPDDDQVSEAILTEMQVDRNSDEFIKEYDSCNVQKQTPMYSILEGKIWPIVAIIKNNLVFACLPYLENLTKDLLKMDYKKLGPVAIAYSLLHNMADVIGPIQYGMQVPEEKIQELCDYLLVCSPFGTPLEMDPATVRGILASKDFIFVPKQKVPAWRPNTFKGKQQMSISIQEQLKCIQYNKSNVPDVCEVFGTISCKADLEGSPEVSLDILATNETNTALTNMISHYCVHQSDSLIPAISSTEEDKTYSNACAVRSFRFCPPGEIFTLCQYKLMPTADSMPIMGYYQMTSEGNKVNFKIHLKLLKGVKNNFEYLNVIMPFFNRPPIAKFETNPTSQNVVLLKDQRTLRWNLGSKFPSKSLDATLEGQVQFSDKGEPIIMPDQFCVGLNSYIQISFKVVDYTCSGMRVDARSISLDPNTKLKVFTGK